MPDDREIIAFRTVEDLWSWLAEHHASHPGVWVRLAKSTGTMPSIAFYDLLEAGIAYGWSESTRRRYDSASYLQKFTPRRTRGTAAGTGAATGGRACRRSRRWGRVGI